MNLFSSFKAPIHYRAKSTLSVEANSKQDADYHLKHSCTMHAHAVFWVVTFSGDFGRFQTIGHTKSEDILSESLGAASLQSACPVFVSNTVTEY